jgi:hypothetical protein
MKQYHVFPVNFDVQFVDLSQTNDYGRLVLMFVQEK